jgi:hypothetical protein
MTVDPAFQTSALERVQDGMTVLDGTGTRLGKVKRLYMGDPQAVTTQGQISAGAGVGVAVAPASSGGGTTAFGAATPLADVDDAPAVAEPLRTTLLRTGFMELEDTQLDGPARYIAGDRIAKVTGDTVRLRSEPPRDSSPGFAPNREPMLRTYVGTPSYVATSRWRFTPRVWITGGAGVGIVSTGATIAVWMFQRRRRRARMYARIRTRVGGVGGALLLTLLLRMIANRLRNDKPRTAAVRDLSERGPQTISVLLRQRSRRGPAAFMGALAVGLGFVWWLRRRDGHQPRYIGTPGVESAYGRDRVRSGELPPEYGVEHAH